MSFSYFVVNFLSTKPVFESTIVRIGNKIVNFNSLLLFFYTAITYSKKKMMLILKAKLISNFRSESIIGNILVVCLIFHRKPKLNEAGRLTEQQN